MMALVLLVVDIWNLRLPLPGECDHGSLLDAFRSGIRIVPQHFRDDSSVSTNADESFSKEWKMNSAVLIPDIKHEDGQTFRFSTRALEVFGPSLVEYSIRHAQDDTSQIEPDAVVGLVVKLANRNESMIVLVRKGGAMIIDCIPILEILGPDFDCNDLQLPASKQLETMVLMELFDSAKCKAVDHEGAWNLFRDDFDTKLLSTFLGSPGLSSTVTLVEEAGRDSG